MKSFLAILLITFGFVFVMGALLSVLINEDRTTNIVYFTDGKSLVEYMQHHPASECHVREYKGGDSWVYKCYDKI